MRNFILGVLTGALFMAGFAVLKPAVGPSLSAQASEPDTAVDGPRPEHGGGAWIPGTEFQATYYSHPEEWVWPPVNADEKVPVDHWAYDALDYLRNHAGCLRQYQAEFFNGKQVHSRIEFFEAIRSLELYDMPRIVCERARAKPGVGRARDEGLDEIKDMAYSLNEEFSDVEHWDPLTGYFDRANRLILPDKIVY